MDSPTRPARHAVRRLVRSVIPVLVALVALWPTALSAQEPRAVSPGCALSAEHVTTRKWEVDSAGSGTFTGQVRNLCPFAVGIDVDVDLRDSSGRSVAVARTARLMRLQPGATGQVSAGASLPPGSGILTPTLSLSFHPSSDEATGSCLHLGTDVCLQVDPWLGGAVDALLLSETGRGLLLAAARSGTVIWRMDTPAGTEGVFRPGANLIMLDPRLDAASARERAAVLAHELRHAADFARGVDVIDASDCFQSEENAFRAESQAWLELWGGTLPQPFSPLQHELNMVARLATTNLRSLMAGVLSTYHEQCADIRLAQP